MPSEFMTALNYDRIRTVCLKRFRSLRQVLRFAAEMYLFGLQTRNLCRGFKFGAT